MRSVTSAPATESEVPALPAYVGYWGENRTTYAQCEFFGFWTRSGHGADAQARRWGGGSFRFDVSGPDDGPPLLNLGLLKRS